MEDNLWRDAKYQKTEVWRRMDPVMTKNVFTQTIPDKVFGTK